MYLYVLDLTLDLNSEISNIYCSLDPCDHSADGIIDTHPRHVLDYADHVVLGGSSTYTVRPCYSDPWHNDNLVIAIILAPPLSVPTKYNDILDITIYRYLLHSFGKTIAIRRCHAT
jgi:hypothetical protein